MISFESLYKAHRRARLGKRHKREVIEFEANLSENLWKLHYELKHGTYKVGEYKRFMIYDPKEREIQAIPYRDRIVQHALCDNILSPLLSRYLIYDNCACQKKKGTHFAIKRLKKFMLEHYKKHGTSGYFVKLDIKKYFPSIDQNLLFEKLKKLPLQPQTMSLIQNIIFSYPGTKGIAMGNQSSQNFALYYLDEIDRFIKEKLKVKHYLRYMDDMILLVDNKQTAKTCLKSVENLVLSNLLELNHKSQIISIKNGINFLGFHFFYVQNGKILQVIIHQTMQRIKKKVMYKKICIQHLFLKQQILNASIISYYGHFKQSNSHHFFIKLKIVLS